MQLKHKVVLLVHGISIGLEVHSIIALVRLLINHLLLDLVGLGVAASLVGQLVRHVFEERFDGTVLSDGCSFGSLYACSVDSLFGIFCLLQLTFDVLQIAIIPRIGLSLSCLSVEVRPGNGGGNIGPGKGDAGGGGQCVAAGLLIVHGLRLVMGLSFLSCRLLMNFGYLGIVVRTGFSVGGNIGGGNVGGGGGNVGDGDVGCGGGGGAGSGVWFFPGGIRARLSQAVGRVRLGAAGVSE